MTGYPNKVALLGATGATGRHVLQAARDHGVDVVAVVRDASRLPSREGLTVVETPLSDAAQLTEVFRGCDAVIGALGLARRTPADPPSRHFDAVLQAMQAANVRRFVGVSGAGLTLDGEHKPLAGRVASWLIAKVAGAVVDDKRREYAALKNSDIEWTLARAPRLVDGAPTGRCRVGTDRPPSFRLVRGDLAEFLLAQVHDRTHVRRAPMLGTVG